MKKVRVFIISQEEPFYLPKVIRHILENQGQYEIVGGTVLKPHRKNKSMKDWFLERTKIYTYWELGLVFLAMLNIKLLKRGQPWYSVKRLYEKFNVQRVETADINAANYIDDLKQLNIDIILSISPPQLFKKELLDVPAIASLNAHGTLLPRHRGVFGSWWTIFLEDKEAGSTIHTMEERLDAGEIVYQEEFPVSDTDTQYSIASQTKWLLAKGSVEVLNHCATGPLPIQQVTYAESYHRAPTKEQGHDFRKKGHHIIVSSNLKLVTAKKFENEGRA